MLSTWPIAGFDLLRVSVRTSGAGARGVLALTVEKNDRLKTFIGYNLSEIFFVV